METNEISTCERHIMKVIWDSDKDLALQEIMDLSNEEQDKTWKPQTVSTFLARLTKKGFLSTYRKGRYTYYQPAVSKEDFWKAAMREMAEYFAKNNMGELVCTMCDEMLSPADVQMVREKVNSMP